MVPEMYSSQVEPGFRLGPSASEVGIISTQRIKEVVCSTGLIKGEERRNWEQQSWNKAHIEDGDAENVQEPKRFGVNPHPESLPQLRIFKLLKQVNVLI
jgi:hypothetical protein